MEIQCTFHKLKNQKYSFGATFKISKIAYILWPAELGIFQEITPKEVEMYKKFI